MNQAHHSEKASIKSIIYLLCLISTAFSLYSPAQAQITPDNTLGGEASQLKQNVLINGALGDKIEGGAARGSNLFHSFSEFNIPDGQRVYFANPIGIENILTRVTGGNASNIFGTLGVAGAANLFLINPNGILFGQNARLDVQGSFVGTTANGVQFGNQGLFSATNPQAPPLLTIQPSALWFNQLNQNAAIQNNSVAAVGKDSSGISRFGLRVPDGKSLLLVGGDVSMNGGQLNALGGRVELGGLAQTGNINLVFNGNNLSLKFTENVTRANVLLTNKAGVYVQGFGGGDIAVNARNVKILGGSVLYAGIWQGLGKPEIVAGDITVNGTGEIKIAGSGSRIGNFVRLGSKGNGGNIIINSGSFSLRDGALLNASTYGQGNAGNVTVIGTGEIKVAGSGSGIVNLVGLGSKGNGGNITINSGSFSLRDGALLNASTYGQGNAGNVTVIAKNAVSLAGQASEIFSNVETGGVGNTGGINIRGSSLSLTDGAQLQSGIRGADTNQVAGKGNGGSVDINVTGAVTITGTKNDFPSAIFTNVETGARGNGGNINISSGSFFLTDGAQLIANTAGQGLDSPKSQAGNITLNTIGKIEVAGANSVIRSILLTGGVGNGGNIFIDSGSFSLRDGAQLSASTSGVGNAGNVTVGAKNAVSLANGEIFSTVEAGGVGKGGNIDINAATLSLTDGAQLLTGTSGGSDTQPAGRGDAGNVNIKVTGAVDIVGQKNTFPSAIFSQVDTGTVGNGGNIFIASGSFSLRDGALLSASISGVGNAGNVTVGAKNAISLAGGDIFSTVKAGGVGKGGNIDINAATLSLTDGAQLLTATREASVTQPAGRGDAGNVNVKVIGAIDIAGEKNGFPSGIRSFVDTGAVGNGGNIFIDSGSFSLRDGAKLNASTYGQGNAGNVTVDAKDAVFLAGNAYIFSTVEAGGVGKGGNIDINAATLSLTDGAQLQTATDAPSATQPAGRGDAGNVNIKVTGAVDIVGQKNTFPSAIFSLVGTGAVGNGGNIFIDSGSFSLRDGALLNASTYGQGNAGNVTVGAKNAISLANSNIFSTVEAGGVGKGGNIDINAATLSLTDGAQLITITRGAFATQPAGRGDAGNVNVKVIGAVDIAGEKNGFPSGIRSLVDTGTVGNGGNIFIDSGDFSLRDGAKLSASTYGQGNAGNVTVGAKDAVSLAGQPTAILSTVEAGGVGKGGNIDINAATLSLTDGAQLLASTSGVGNAGNVTVGAKNAVSLAGQPTAILSTVEAGGVGKGGNIDINAATLSLTDSAQLLTITRGASATQPAGRGDAGNVNVKVIGAVDIAGEKNGFPSGIRSLVDTGTVGNGGNIFIDSGDFSLRDGAQLNASTYGQGNAGNIRINAKDAVTVSGTNQETGLSSALFTFTDSTSTGKGGDITVNTNMFRVSDGALLDARTRNNQKGGDITVNANVFEALNGGQLTTTTSSNGRAGKITVNADDKLTISGIDPSYNDRSTNFPDNVANIGANSGLFVSSTGSGITGDIEVNSPQITLDNQGKLNAESASGNGGNINVNSNLLLLRHGAKISTNAGTAEKGGDGGNININSRFIIAIPEENSDISANAFTGTGGNIQINSQGIFGIESRPKPTNKSDITASSELGVSGVTNINAPDNSSIQNSFTELSPNVIDTNALIANSCISRGTKRQENSFTITGSGALRNSPGNGLVSTYTTGEVRGVEQTSRSWKKGDPIIEPQGLYRLPNGQLILSRSCSL
ncbi:MAG: two-partner secretion domain-containing protein [Nostoc sp.]